MALAEVAVVIRDRECDRGNAEEAIDVEDGADCSGKRFIVGMGRYIEQLDRISVVVAFFTSSSLVLKRNPHSSNPGGQEVVEESALLSPRRAIKQTPSLLQTHW